MAKRFFSLPTEIKMEVGAQSFGTYDLFYSTIRSTKKQIEYRKTPNFKGYSPLLSGNNNPEGAGDLQEGFEFGWEDFIKDNDSGDSSGVMAGANVWPSEEHVSGFRQSVLDYQ